MVFLQEGIALLGHLADRHVDHFPVGPIRACVERGNYELAHQYRPLVGNLCCLWLFLPGRAACVSHLFGRDSLLLVCRSATDCLGDAAGHWADFAFPLCYDARRPVSDAGQQLRLDLYFLFVHALDVERACRSEIHLRHEFAFVCGEAGLYLRGAWRRHRLGQVDAQ